MNPSVEDGSVTPPGNVNNNANININNPTNEDEAPTTPKPVSVPMGITVRDQRGESLFFRIKPTTRFQKVFDNWFSKHGGTAGTKRFIFDGRRINGDETPAEVEMEDGDVVEVFEEQVGGAPETRLWRANGRFAAGSDATSGSEQTLATPSAQNITINIYNQVPGTNVRVTTAPAQIAGQSSMQVGLSVQPQAARTVPKARVRTSGGLIGESVRNATQIPTSDEAAGFYSQASTLHAAALYDESKYNTIKGTPFQFYIKSLTGKIGLYRLGMDNTIGELKSMYQDKEGVPPDQQGMIFAGYDMEDDRTATQYKLTQGCEVHQVMKLRGGLT